MNNVNKKDNCKFTKEKLEEVTKKVKRYNKI